MSFMEEEDNVWKCPVCGGTNTVIRYRCNKCKAIHQYDTTCPCNWSLNNEEIEICLHCRKEKPNGIID